MIYYEADVCVARHTRQLIRGTSGRRADASVLRVHPCGAPRRD